MVASPLTGGSVGTPAVSMPTGDATSPASAVVEAPEAVAGVLPRGWSTRRHEVLAFDEVSSAQASPPLTLPDGRFGLIWALDAFTRFREDWAGWLLDLRRVLADDGVAVVALASAADYEGLTGLAWDDDAVGMNRVARESAGPPMIFHSEWWLRSHWGRAFEIVSYDVREGRPWVVMSKRAAAISPHDLELPEPGEKREALALQTNVASLWKQHEALRERIGYELDAQREELNREIMRKSFEISELEWGWGGPDSASAITAAQYQATLSWRITKPLRAVNKLIRRF